MANFRAVPECAARRRAEAPEPWAIFRGRALGADRPGRPALRELAARGCACLAAVLVLVLSGCVADTSPDSLAQGLAPLEAEAAPAASADGSQAASPADPEPQTTPTTVSASDLRRMIYQESSTVVIDVRTDQEYRQGHVPTAILLPYDLIDAQTAAAVVPALDSPVVVYCRSGRRSAQAAQALAELGYTNVCDFGTIDAWPYGVVVGDQDGTASATRTTMPNTVTPPSYHNLPYLTKA